MSRQRLSAIETAYVELAARGTPIQIGSVGIFEGAPLLDDDGRFRLEEARSRVASRLHLLPRLRQRIEPAPFGAGRPVWIDAADFDVADHVTVVSLCRPHDEAALLELAADLQVEPLSPARPPWHLTFVTGLTGGRVGLIERASHALVDGVSGVDLAVVLLDLEPDAPQLPPPSWEPEPDEPVVDALRHALADQLAVPRRVLGATLAALTHPTSLPQHASEIVHALEATARDGLAPPSSLNQPIGPRRSLRTVRQDLAVVRDLGRAHGATVNEVVLAAVSGGLRDLLLARGEELPSALELKALVPVSLRADHERGTLGNRVSALLMPLPVGIGDPDERLRRIVAASRRLKADGEATTGATLLELADTLPAPLVGAAMQLLDHQPLVNLVVTNVPGPATPLYALGARLLEAVPMVPLAGNLSLGVAVLSYCGQLTLGITADTATCRDVGTFVAGVERAFRALSAVRLPAA